MRPLKGYAQAQAYSDNERLPVGGYVLKILDVKYRDDIRGDVITLSFDIAEGEHKDFFARNYKTQTGEDKRWKGVYRLYVPKDDGSEQDAWTMRRFKTAIVNFEESNPGYHWNWDEQTLKGKLIGALFNNKEYEMEGRHGFFTNCHSLVSAEKIRSGKFKVPEDTLLKKKMSSEYPAGAVPMGDGFMNIPDNVEDEGLPFN
ncbi:MAG: hypothetical protein Q4E24_16115 [bacterium]|nr:hypothetical protein [bacterium]